MPANQEPGQHPYKCMWCGHDYTEYFDPGAALVERSCPSCRSNSVRRIKPKPGGKRAPEKQKAEGA